MIAVSINLSSTSTRTYGRVRLWVESMERSTIAETEICLAEQGPGSWTGRIPRDLLGASGSFLYRLAIAARAGSLWSMQLLDEETSLPLERDCDVMDECKTWLVGSCSPARTRSARKPMAPARDSAPSADPSHTMVRCAQRNERVWSER